MWTRKNQIVEGAYLDTIPYTGVVVESRVGRGFNIIHDVELLEPITVYGEVRNSILVSENEIFVQIGEVFEVEPEGETA
jgi:hypothetical protein